MKILNKSLPATKHNSYILESQNSQLHLQRLSSAPHLLDIVHYGQSREKTKDPNRGNFNLLL